MVGELCMEVSYIQHYVVAIQSMNFVPMTCTSPKIPLTVLKKKSQIKFAVCGSGHAACSFSWWLMAGAGLF
jgi:transcription elongation factor Elf1